MFGGVLVNWATDHSVTVPLVGAVGGWRLAIFVVGLLGLPLALLMALTMREAPRRITTPAPPFADLGRYIMRRPAAMIGTLTAFSFATVANYVVRTARRRGEKEWGSVCKSGGS